MAEAKNRFGKHGKLGRRYTPQIMTRYFIQADIGPFMGITEDQKSIALVKVSCSANNPLRQSVTAPGCFCYTCQNHLAMNHDLKVNSLTAFSNSEEDAGRAYQSCTFLLEDWALKQPVALLVQQRR